MACCACEKSKKDPTSVENTKNEKYEFGQILGTGGFATVYECKRLSDNKKMACKTMNLEKYKNSKGKLNPKVKKMIDEEIRLMQELSGKHPVLLKIFEVEKLDEFQTRIFIEICHGKDLYDGIFKRKVKQVDQVRQICVQLVRCIAYLHSKKIVHLDLKPENIAFKSSNPDDMTIKLLDFGLAKQRSFRKVTGFRGTREYMSPEIALRLGYTEAADMWAIGTMIFEMTFAKVPFPEKENHNKQKCNQKLKNLFGHVDADLSSEHTRDLITQLLKYDPGERLTANEALLHPFFDEHTTYSDKNMIANFELFARRGQLQKALLPVMQKHANQKKNFLRENLLAMHKISDLNGDGVLDFEEFMDLLTRANFQIGKLQAKEIFDGLEREGKRESRLGTIEVWDLLEWFEYDFIMSQDERLWEFIAQLDEEGNGQISMKNIEDAISSSTGDAFGDCLKKLKEVFGEDDIGGYESFAELFRNDVAQTIFSFPTTLQTTIAWPAESEYSEFEDHSYSIDRSSISDTSGGEAD